MINNYIIMTKRMKDSQNLQTIAIYIRLYNGNGHLLRIDREKSVNQLIKIVNGLKLEVPESYRMMVNGKPIIDFNKSLSECRIGQNSIIHIQQNIEKDQRHVKIDVCIYYNHQKFIVKSYQHHTVLDLKKNIFKLMKIYPKDQMLLFNGIVLKNDKPLQKYKIKTDALICLHSYAPNNDEEEILSDYDENNENFIKNDSHLLDSVLSLNRVKHQISKTTLFRSDSLGTKSLRQLEPYEIEIRQRLNNQQELDNRQFNYALFNSFGFSNPNSSSMIPQLCANDCSRDLMVSLRFDCSNDKYFNVGEGLTLMQSNLIESIASFDG